MNDQMASSIANETDHYNGTNDEDDKKVALPGNHTPTTRLNEAYNLDSQHTSLIMDIHTIVN